MNQINEKTVVPVGWVLTGFAAILSITVIGSFWISTVSFRLERIEEKLGIPPYRVTIFHDSSEAMASESK